MMDESKIKLETIKQIRLIINYHLINCSNYDAVIKAVEHRIQMTKDLLSSNKNK